MPVSRRQFAVCALLVCAGVVPLASVAQEFPTKTITIVVPFSAGGGVDVVARLFAEKLRTSLGQSVIVDNKPGASGMLGAMAVVRAPADGHTLLLGSAGETAINPYIYKTKMQYAPEKDLAPITAVVRVPNVLVASASAPFNSRSRSRRRIERALRRTFRRSPTTRRRRATILRTGSACSRRRRHRRPSWRSSMAP